MPQNQGSYSFFFQDSWGFRLVWSKIQGFFLNEEAATLSDGFGWLDVGWSDGVAVRRIDR